MEEVKMPRLGVTMQAGKVAQWYKQEGEQVQKGEPLFELESEKSSIEIEAQTSGVLRKILVEEEVEVPVNRVIALIGTIDEELELSKYYDYNEMNSEIASPSRQETNEDKEEVDTFREGETIRGVRVSPRVRKLAKELGISLDVVQGSGPGGVITEKDIRSAIEEKEPNVSLHVRESIPLNHIKQAMSASMVSSWTTIPQFTQIVSVNMERALHVKAEWDGVTMNDILIKASAIAAERYPIVNSRLQENQIVVYEEVNISVAVSGPQGLHVPVVKNVQKKSIATLSQEIKELAEKAKMNRLTPDDFAEGTLTVSNLGAFGIETGTPIINAPQCAVVFAGAIQKTPVVNEQDEIVVAPMMKLAICYDHRFIDGVTGAQFTGELKRTLEQLTTADME